MKIYAKYLLILLMVIRLQIEKMNKEIHKKEQLLELERADMSRFFLPEKGAAL